MLKKCPKCGRTSPPALAVCPRCKTPFNATLNPPPREKSTGRQLPDSSPADKNSDSKVSYRTAVTAAVLVVLVLVLAAVLLMNRQPPIAGSAQPSDRTTASPREIVRPSNFNELLGTWSGREINRNSEWTFSFADGYNVYASGPEGWYRGKAAIHWELGSGKDGLRVPPGAGVLDVDIEESSARDYVSKTSVGAFSVHGGTTLKLCSGEPGKSRRPESFEPASGIRCFELTKTADAPLSPPAQPTATAPEAPSVEDEETRAARDAYKRCAEAVRSGNISHAKTFLSRATLQEIEQSGQIEMALGIITGMDINEFQASRQGDRITFKQSQKQGDATMSVSFKMVREDGQWKLGI